MTTKHLFRGKFKLVLREDDHLPAHVHVIGGGVNVSIDLESLRMKGELPQALVVEVLEYVKSHRDELMEEWKKWHP